MDNNFKIQQNLDTDFLKLVAIMSMALDHFGKVFFPGQYIFVILGRIAFPIFAYCIVVGCLYTRDINKYLIRLGIFAVLSQPFYNLAFHPHWPQFYVELWSLNILFTLIAGVFVIRALMEPKRYWWLGFIALGMEFFIGLDYGLYGIILMVLFYAERNNSLRSLLWVFVWMVVNSVRFVPFYASLQFFAVLALPFIYLHTDFKIRIPKYFFYGFYPAHLIVIYVLRLVLKV